MLQYIELHGLVPWQVVLVILVVLDNGTATNFKPFSFNYSNLLYSMVFFLFHMLLVEEQNTNSKSPQL
jgi:hypothetical protein